MGCVFSQTGLRREPGLYKVSNVDDQGNEVSGGYIDIHGSNLILFQDGREPIRWPLRCLRRYGYEDDLFSFESGRRCPTGAGIYAFKCNRTESLFTNLQESILRTGQMDNSRYNRSNPVTRGTNTTSTGTNTVSGTENRNTSENGNGVPRQGYTALFACRSRPQGQNQNANQQNRRDYMNSGLEQISTMRLRPGNIVEIPPEGEQQSHEYVNTTGKQDDNQVVGQEEDDMAYENVELGAVYCNVGQGPAPPRPARNSAILNGNVQEPEPEPETAINYIQLVVGSNGKPREQQNQATVTEEAHGDGDKYAKIDFAATEALSKANNIASDDGCRRTRHNGTLS